MSLKKKNRLSKKEIAKIFLTKSGRLSTPLLNIIYNKENNQKNFRIGIIVSTRLDKRATVRNQIKRKIKSAVSWINKKSPLPAINIIIQPKKETTKTNEEEIRCQLLKLFEKLKANTNG